MSSQPVPSIQDLYSRLDHVSLADAARFRRRLAKARSPKARAAIADDLATAARTLAAKHIPTPTFPDQLPVTAHLDDIAEAISTHQVVVIAGETGSGKTTQIPKICLTLGRGRRGLIGHTQPRRLAARTVAERIADELGETIGDTVGYAIRFDDRVSDAAAIKLMTDGILLAEMQHDRDLLAYDTIIIDEAHERSLNIDFLLGYLKQLLPRRPDLKVIITSATIDPERFATHFAQADGTPAPIIEVSGRTYPVEIRYRPPVDIVETKDGSLKEIDRDPLEALCDACEELMAEGPGDILCFFSGEREIRDAAEAMEGRHWPRTEISMLFGRLSNQEQHQVFQPHQGRRIVLATNIAETSLTVPGIHYVVDTGTARISRYSNRTKVQRLPVEPISQASANQRSGRCGRIADGVAIRLYSEDEFNSRPEFTDPEILRTNLASVILNMAALRLGDIADFPFIDAPDSRSIRDGLLVLHELGALAEGEKDGNPILTQVGRQLARIPLDPRLGRILVHAHTQDVLEIAAVVVAALSLQDIRERPLDKEPQADQAHARFKNTTSDFLTTVNLWAYVSYQRHRLSGNQFRRLCYDEFLHYMRTREWMDLVRQIKSVTQQLGWEWDDLRIQGRLHGDDDLPSLLVPEDHLHQSMLTGLLAYIGLKDEQTREYHGARNTRFYIFPGSGLAKKTPSWVVAAEIVETSNMFARNVAAVNPSWIEHAGRHLLKHQYSQPHWSKKRASAVAYQRSTLFGLAIVVDRPVNYATIDPVASREIFIRSALVEGDWNTNHHFFHTNRDKLDQAAEIEEKARRRDLLIDDDTLFDFYDQRIPLDVTTGRHFDAWWKKQRTLTPDLLDFDPDKLLADDADTIAETDFPDRWTTRDFDLDLSYRFEPGTPDDGVSVRIPLPILANISADDGFDWQVPGLREELITAMIRSLPKALRTTVVPAPQFAAKAMEIMAPYETPLASALANALRTLGGSGMTAADFNTASLPPHLRINFQAIDRHGAVIDQDRDLEALKKRQQAAAHQAMSAAFARSRNEHSTSGRKKGKKHSAPTPADAHRAKNRVFDSWTAQGIGTLPESVEAVVDGQATTAYPTLRVTPQGIELLTVSTKAAADASLFTAELTLLLRRISVKTAPMVKGLPLTQRVAVDNYPHGGAEGLVDDCRVAAVRDALLAAGGVVRSPEEFDALAKEIDSHTAPAVRRMVVTMAQNLVTYAHVRQQLSEWSGEAIDDMRRQLETVLPPNAVSRYGIGKLQHLDRYMKAVEVRLDSLDSDPDRDADRQDEVNEVEQYLEKKLATLPETRAHSAAVRDVIFQIQELRVSLFAERLGTAQRVSAKRIMKAIDQIK